MSALNEKGLVGEVTDWDFAITVAMATKTPVAAMAARHSSVCRNSLFTHAVYKPTDTAVTAVADGATTTPDGYVEPTAINFATQEIRQAYKLTRKAEAAETYNRYNTLAWQKAKALEMLQIAKEKLFLSRQDIVKGVGTSTAQKCRGLINLLSPKAMEIQSVEPIPDAYRLPIAHFENKALANLTADDFATLMTKVADTWKGELTLTGIVGAQLGKTMSGWSWRDITASGPHALTIRKGDEKATVDMSVQVFKFDEVTVNTMTSHYLDYNLSTGAANTMSPLAGLFIDPAMLGQRVFQELRSTDKPDYDGDGKGGFWAWDGCPTYDCALKAALVLPGEILPDSDSDSDSDSDGE